MRFDRACGTLVHPTSFPSDFGIGDLGSAAYAFIRFLESTHQSIWQILPLGPTGYGNSPYASYSAFAGNAYLISPDILLGKGLLTKADVDPLRISSGTRADYDTAYAIKDTLFDIASKRFYAGITAETKAAFAAFQAENAYWLPDYARFMAGLLANGKQPWNTWDQKTLTGKKLQAEISTT